MIDLLLHYRFIQYAVLTAILTSIVCGIIGVIIVEKKLVMMTGGIAHTAYGGVGLGYLLNFEPIIGAFIFALMASFGVGLIRDKEAGNRDVAIGLMWSLGMALGVVFIALTPGYPPNISTYLFGSILSITSIEFYMIVGLTILIVFVIVTFYHHWVLFIFDEEFAFSKHIKVNLMRYALLSIIALTIVALIRVVGIILVIALLTAPAATAKLLSHQLKHRMIIASVLGIGYSFLGLYFAYIINIASGSAIAITAVIMYLIVFLGKKIVNKTKGDNYGEMHISNR